jgi:hypothetical protein
MNLTQQHGSRLIRFVSFDTIISVIPTLIGGVAFANLVLGFGATASLILGVIIAATVGGLLASKKPDESPMGETKETTPHSELSIVGAFFWIAVLLLLLWYITGGYNTFR